MSVRLCSSESMDDAVVDCVRLDCCRGICGWRHLIHDVRQWRWCQVVSLLTSAVPDRPHCTGPLLACKVTLTVTTVHAVTAHSVSDNTRKMSLAVVLTTWRYLAFDSIFVQCSLPICLLYFVLPIWRCLVDNVKQIHQVRLSVLFDVHRIRKKEPTVFFQHIFVKP